MPCPRIEGEWCIQHRSDISETTALTREIDGARIAPRDAHLDLQLHRSVRELKRSRRGNSSASKETALHFEGIKKGVQVASSTRVDEVKEDVVWVETVMEPLRGFGNPLRL